MAIYVIFQAIYIHICIGIEVTIIIFDCFLLVNYFIIIINFLFYSLYLCILYRLGALLLYYYIILYYFRGEL